MADARFTGTRSARLTGAACVATATAALGCAVGEGSGRVSGEIFVDDCFGTRSLGTRMVPHLYDMAPTFFAGEPIEDIAGGTKDNRLLIRLQRSGKRIEVNDMLVFDVRDAYEVARCVRGEAFDSDLCDHPPGGVARIKVGIDQPIRAALTLFATCRARTVGVTTSSGSPPIGVATSSAGGTPDAWESWIELAEFGSASSGNGSVGADFKVNFGETLHAPAFQLSLRDDRAVKAGKNDDEIGGRLDGDFIFELKRGRAAQSFP